MGVSIHAPARGATAASDDGKTIYISFQFTRPRGARLPRAMRGARSGRFQFTRPRGARRLRHCLPRPPSGFNSRAREGRDARPAWSSRPGSVSIHAPARGATVRANRCTSACPFQFTRPRGARPLRASLRRARIVSIHAPARGATRIVCDYPRHYAVSIHAPARGATIAPPPFSPTSPSFNSRAREGRDHAVRSFIFPDAFQFTRPRGARRSVRVICILLCCFNSRAREGRDQGNCRFQRNARVSIHAPARGATPACVAPRGRPSGFNSRAREGRDGLLAR